MIDLVRIKEQPEIIATVDYTSIINKTITVSAIDGSFIERVYSLDDVVYLYEEAMQ